VCVCVCGYVFVFVSDFFISMANRLTNQKASSFRGEKLQPPEETVRVCSF